MASESAATRSPIWILRWPNFVVVWANDHALQWWCLTESADETGGGVAQESQESQETDHPAVDRPGDAALPPRPDGRSPLAWPAPVSNWLRSLVTTYQDVPQPVTPGRLTCPVATAMGWKLMPCTVALMGVDHAVPPLWVIEGVAGPNRTEVATWAQVPNTPTPAAPSPTWWEAQGDSFPWAAAASPAFPGVDRAAPLPPLPPPEITASKITASKITASKITPPGISGVEISTPEITTPEIATPEIATPEIATPEITTPEISPPNIAARKPAHPETTLAEPSQEASAQPGSPLDRTWSQLPSSAAARPTYAVPAVSLTTAHREYLSPPGSAPSPPSVAEPRGPAPHAPPLSQPDAALLPWSSLGDILMQLTASDDVNVDISAALAQLGANLLVNRLSVFRYHQHPVSEAPLASYRWEWCSTAVEPQLNNLELQNVTLQQFPPQWHERLHQGQWAMYGCQFGGDSALGEMASEDEPWLASADTLHLSPDWLLRVQQVCWAIAVPIPIGGQLWGFLMAGRDQTQPPWQDTERVMLQTVACGLGNAIARHQSQVTLRSFNEQIESVIQQRTFKFRAAIQQLQQEIRDRQRAEDQLRYTTFHDALTGLPNRMSLIHTLNQVIAEVQLPMSPEVQDQRAIALVLIDIDRLEVVNNTMGHAMGDELLAAIAERLQRQLPEDYFVARFGGDEFAILAEGVTTMSGAERLATQVQALFLQAFPVDDQDVFTSATLGIALSDPDYKRPESMLRDADIAMRRAKRTGGGNYAIFDRTIHQHAITDLYLETELRRAIQALGFDPTCSPAQLANCQFFLTYQPVVETQTQIIRGFEALVRWQHPDLGLVSPAQFIPIAEKTGAIVPLGNWILYQACRQLQQWQRGQAEDPGAIAPLEMAVNLSCRQFAQPDLIAQVERAIADHHIAPETLKLEITESTIMEGSNLAKRALAALQSRGMQLCMDDFGTGYSSLSYLHRLPLNVLKIDRAFVMRLGQRGENTAIIRTIITLAQHFGLKVVAEGVETMQQFKLLKSLGCEFVQGYLFSRPLSVAEATELLAEQRRNPQGLWDKTVQNGSVHQA